VRKLFCQKVLLASQYDALYADVYVCVHEGRVNKKTCRGARKFILLMKHEDVEIIQLAKRAGKLRF
jgi:hypothetical protein